MSSALQSTVLFLLLSKYDNHQRDMLHRVRALKEMEDCPVHATVLQLFATDEIVPYPFAGHTALLAALRAPRHSVSGSDTGSLEDDEHFTALLPARVVQLNLRIASKYYSRISGGRLAALLGLSTEDLEAHLSEVIKY
jgi:hypothetical protein